MKSCPTCGATTTDQIEPAGNAEAEIILRVPERHFALMRKTFDEMNMRLGMYGLGELANALNAYGDPFRVDTDHLRYFDDGALAMACTGVTWGYGTEVRFADARNNRKAVFIDFIGPDGKARPMKMADNATPEAAEWFKAYFDDLSERLRPMADGASVDVGSVA